MQEGHRAWGEVRLRGITTTLAGRGRAVVKKQSHRLFGVPVHRLDTHHALA